jgi:cob(I)alamin adenosyltransferase
VRIYTKKGDGGSTQLLYGMHVRKDAPLVEANGAVDEAQAALGVARAEAEGLSWLAELLLALQRDLWVLMAELATPAEHRDRLRPGESLVDDEMVAFLEESIDRMEPKVVMPDGFVVPGQNRLAASLDMARTVVRRAERAAVVVNNPGSLVVVYLNRLSDLCWMAARLAEGESLPTRVNPRR